MYLEFHRSGTLNQIEKRQSVGIYDVLNAQGFAMISNVAATLKFSDKRDNCSGFSQQRKRMD